MRKGANREQKNLARSEHFSDNNIDNGDLCNNHGGIPSDFQRHYERYFSAFADL